MCVAAGRVIIAMTCYVTDACVYEGKHYQPHDKVKKDCNIWLVSHDFSSLCAALSHIGLSIGGSSSILVCRNLIHHSSAHRLRSFQQHDSLVVMFQSILVIYMLVLAPLVLVQATETFLPVCLTDLA